MVAAAPSQKLLRARRSKYRLMLASQNEFLYMVNDWVLPIRVRADIIGHARINIYVNISHAWFKMAEY